MAGRPGSTRRKVRAARKRRPVAIGAEERRHLIEACAYFRADRFRPAEPGSIRSSDVRAATAAIDAILRAPRRGRKKK